MTLNLKVVVLKKCENINSLLEKCMLLLRNYCLIIDTKDVCHTHTHLEAFYLKTFEKNHDKH